MAGTWIDPQAPAPLPESLARLRTAVDAAARAGDDRALACQTDSAEDLLRNLAHFFEARVLADTSAAAELAGATADTPPHAESDASPPRRGQVVRRRRRRSPAQRRWLKKKRRLIALCASYALLLVGGYLLFGFFKTLIVSLSD